MAGGVLRFPLYTRLPDGTEYPLGEVALPVRLELDARELHDGTAVAAAFVVGPATVDVPAPTEEAP